MVRLKELKRIFLEVREKLVAESHKLMSELKTDFNSNYDGAIGTVHRMLEVFEGLKVLSRHSESFLGALEAEGRVAEAKVKLHAHLEEFAIPVAALKRHKGALKEADLSILQSVLERESGRDSLKIDLPEEMDPVIVSLSEIFPEIFAALLSDCQSDVHLVAIEESGSDDGLDDDKAALVKALMEDDLDDDDDLNEHNTITQSMKAPVTLPVLDEVIAAQIGLSLNNDFESVSDISGNEDDEDVNEVEVTDDLPGEAVEENLVDVAEPSVTPCDDENLELDNIDESVVIAPEDSNDEVEKESDEDPVEQIFGQGEDENSNPIEESEADASITGEQPEGSADKEEKKLFEDMTEDDVDFTSEDDLSSSEIETSLDDEMADDIDDESLSDDEILSDVDENFLGAMFSEADEDGPEHENEDDLVIGTSDIAGDISAVDSPGEVALSDEESNKDS